MIMIYKITTGFVSQQFDETTGRCIRQDFIGGDGPAQFEDGFGDPIEEPDAGCEFPLDMVQPPEPVDPMQPLPSGAVGMAISPEPPPERKPLIASAYSFDTGEQVEVVPLDNGDPPENEFMGTVIGIKDARYVMVQDQDGDVFDCEPIQVHHLN